MACHEGHTEIVDSLLKGGANPNLAMKVDRFVCLHMYVPSTEVTVHFFSQNSSIVPLGITAAKGHTDTVQRLLEGGANINHCNKVMST